ncbi:MULTISPECIES: response regulator [unclassified Paenibacillus]|uniref:response regulator n=1 Tax=unclassified Paenibacillus TaxID=185978 RepID=UPI0024072FFC|nr:MULTISPECIES: response regulator [unclassified Paenibacillus]MDF9843387.1 two-component system response regulator YesN [Paenibacillus sp. PastF-2]MDF9849975.1 two-component system response regulator YesN [Paenibacillus sp. PastM-2]MDF9856683.1 two-component system response regulator YesN [Paenibacillus sp. PastF-1]MDH6481953.1 two-component system response regulator YesN [Paenibacillus sp. PastH-2]MDH6509378.1 two-component system response regulator YesN [Paenibacillus sp. PastM-3]
MRILIVDDEPLVRIGLKSAIDWKGNGMEIVGEAADGEEALQQIAHLKPDIVFLDIKMPKKDGIAVLSEMRERGLQANVIILSSFDDITYVKEAMKLGASDYFHKPAMNEQEIASVLKTIQAETAQSRPQGEPKEAARMEEVPYKENSLWEGLRGNIQGMQNTGLKEGNIYVLVFTVKHYAGVMKRYSENHTSILPNTVGNIVTEVLSKEKETEFLQVNDRLSAVFISNSDLKSLLASLNRINGIVQMIAAALKRFVNIEVVFGISDWFSSFAELEQGYAQALKALKQRFYLPDTSVFYHNHRKPVAASGLKQAGELLAEMKNALKEGNEEEFAEALARWERLLEETRCMEEQDVRKVYEGLLFMLDEKEQPSGEEARALENFAELSSYYRHIFERKIKERNSGHLKTYSLLTRNIIQYVEQHYKEDMSLKLLGEQFQVSPNYVSRLFKQEVGRGVFEYINEVRIRHAKVLLKDYRYKIYEVSEQVGFNSQAHFAIVFQKYTGVSPKEYRNEEV